MKHATIRKMQGLVLAGILVLAVPAMFGQRRQQQQQQQPQQVQQPQQQTQQPMQQQGQQQYQQQPQQQGMMQGQAQSWCANRPLCYEANDYVVTVTEFRTSTDGRGSKILDAMLHFQNKTNQPISLGYVDQSGGAIDDMGNRYLLNTYNGGVRGMGVIAGQNMDPKFTLTGGGGGDARLEFWFNPYNKLTGVNFQMEFSIREMNRVEGNQWMLGDESLIHYQGLASGMGVAPVSGGSSVGMSGGMGQPGVVTGGGAGTTVNNVGNAISSYVPGQTTASGTATQPIAYAAAGQPCPAGTVPANGTGNSRLSNIANTAGAQNQTAGNAVNNASSAISSLGGLFKKKNAANANTNAAAANGAVPCLAATNANMNAAGTINTMANPTAPQAAGNPLMTAPATTAGAPNAAAPVTNGKGAAIGRAVNGVNAAAGVRTNVAAQPVNTAVAPTAPAPAAQTQAVTRTALRQPGQANAKAPAAQAGAKKPAVTPAPANTNTTTGAGK
jgi:hypothetical protein